MTHIHRRNLLLGLCLGVCLAVASPLRAADPAPKAFWVGLDPVVPNTVIVTIDASNVGSKFYFENVRLVLGMYDGAGNRIGVQELPVGLVTPAGWTYIVGAKGLQRHATTFRPEDIDPRTAWLRSDKLRWANRGALGGKAEGESPWFEMQPKYSPYFGFASPPR